MIEFELFVNQTDIEIIQIDIKVVEQSFQFQESFAAIVFYKSLNHHTQNKVNHENRLH